MKLAGIAAFAVSLTVTSAYAADLAGSASGSPALALAAVISPYSDLSPLDKVTVAALFDGETGKVAGKKISVAADKIMCRTSNVDLTSRSCELTFKGRKHSLHGSEANELFATIALAGIAPEGAAGANIASVSKLTCALDVGQIKQKDGGGASCAFDAGN